MTFLFLEVVKNILVCEYILSSTEKYLFLVDLVHYKVTIIMYNNHSLPCVIILCIHNLSLISFQI